MKKLVAAALAAGALSTGLVGSAQAYDLILCEVSVYIDKRPAVYTGNPIGVETGEYRPYTNCIEKASL